MGSNPKGGDIVIFYKRIDEKWSIDENKYVTIRIFYNISTEKSYKNEKTIQEAN